MICVGVIIVAAISVVSCGAATAAAAAAAPYIMGAFIGAGMEIFMQTVLIAGGYTKVTLRILMKTSEMEKKISNKNIKLLYIILASLLVLVAVITLIVLLVVPSKLERIEIVSLPTKTEYVEGQTVDTEGMVVMAYYNNKSEAVTGFSIDKTRVEYGDERVNVSYSYGKTTKSTSYTVSVAKKIVTALEVLSQPNEVTYIEGSLFKPDGIILKAFYNNSEAEVVDGWNYDKKVPLQVTDSCVKIFFGGMSVDITINVKPKELQAITVESLPYKLAYKEGEFFDFLGLEIGAEYRNAPKELIKDWDYDKKTPLTTEDTSVQVFYSLHGETKTTVIPIYVSEVVYAEPEIEHINNVLSLLPPPDELTANDLQSIEYVLKLLENLSDPEQEYLTVKENLELKRQEILDRLPTAPETVYIINYCIANGLSFSDIDFGNNIVEYRNSDGVIELASAHSPKATDEGYIFKGWLMNGQPVKTLENLSGDVTLFADFELTPTVNIIFKNYEDSSELLTLENLPRTGSYDFDAEKIKERIYTETQLLPIAYFSDKTRIYSADLSIGKIVTVNVLIAAAREVHLSDSGNVSVGWTYEFKISGEKLLTSALTDVGTVFVVPIGATVILTAMHANISDILVDGVSKGEKLNNSLVRAEFQLSDGEYPASVTLKTVLSEMTTLSFVGYNQHSVVYPLNWNGLIAEVDLERIYFIFDEGNEHYQVSYIIDGKTYYFEDLEKYEFKGDTQIKVNRVRNSFSFTVVYLNGTEKIEGITGKQTLRSAFEKLDPEALEIVNTIISESRLYSDKIAGATITTEELFATVLHKDIVIYSDWERPAVKPQEPEFGDVDYSAYGFVKEWNSLFTDDGNILSSDFVLTQDGLYTYKTFVNGNLSADISGVYRIENGQIVLKTFNLNYEYQLVDSDDLFVDIEFADDGLIRASFIELQGTSMTVFEHTLFSGNVRPANYTNREFLGLYELDVIKIELKANGTAAINYQSESYELYYRVNEDGRLYVFNNGVFGTGELVGLFGGNENENR